MPYIKPEKRVKYKALENLMDGEVAKGELTYCAYKLGIDYIVLKGENYQNISDAISALTDAAEEIRRRVMFPYEDKKAFQNGDI